MRNRLIAIVVIFLVASAEPVSGQFPRDFFCDSHLSLETVLGASPQVALFVCPEGDTESFIEQGWWIRIEIVNGFGPVPGIDATSFWLVEVCDPARDASLCGGRTSSNADSATNANGMTTMSLTTLSGGGCADGMAVAVDGIVLLDTLSCSVYQCLPIHVRSPDIDGNLIVNLVDLSIFSASYPPQPYSSCCDFDIDGVISLEDLSKFAAHFGPPGHQCP